jgi:hypothetical protein
MFPMSMMGALGIDQANCDERDQMGAGGLGKFYCWPGGTLPATFFKTVTVNLKVQFSATPFILLGREDFFSEFKVSFDQRKGQFVVENYG